MRRLALLLLLLLPSAAAGAEPPPAPEPATLVGAPYLARARDGTIRLHFRLDQPLERRFDGLILGSASIAGHPSSLGSVRGRHSDTNCYVASAHFRAHLGRRYLVRVFTTAEETAPIERRLILRAERAGDARGRPLGC